MSVERAFGFLVISFIALAAVTAKSKYYDGEIRPYEFGYRIEGNQHRHEMKDANGIINGEFGFITGDGTYHQSVYATDADGNFKLISRRSSFRIVKSTTTAQPTTTVPPAPASHTPKLLKVLKSCSNCKVLVTEQYDKASPTAPDAVAVTRKGEIIHTRNEDSPNNVAIQQDKINVANKQSTRAKLVSSVADVPKIKVKSNSGTIDTISPINVALGITSAGVKASEQIKLKHNERQEQNSVKIKANEANINRPSGVKASPIQSKQKALNEIPIQQIPKPVSSAELAIPIQQIPKPVSSAELAIPIQQIPKPVSSAELAIPIQQIPKPVSSAEVSIPVSLQTKSVITVPISSDDYIKTTSQDTTKTQLSSKKAINEFIGDVLYRFNYTAGYHGHNEEGDTAGNKRGSYFIIGRDNIRRGVIYVANANGFAPVVKYEKVSSAEAPHEDTEKSAGLRGYEFEWFHKGKSKIDSSSLKGSRR